MTTDLLSRKTPVLLDGATGTWLLARGYPSGAPSAAANLDRPDLVRDVAREYAAAGCDVVTANSFGALGPWPEHHPARNRGPELARVAIRLAREGAARASGEPPLVAANLGPALAPAEDNEPELERLLPPVFEAMAEEAPDLLLLEGQVSIADAVTAVRLARAAFGDSLPILSGYAWREDGLTLAGEAPEDAAAALEDAGCDAIGASCSWGPAPMMPVVRRLAVATRRSVWAKPNAGVPGSRNHPLLGDEDFSGAVLKLLAVGARLVGGCCGTTPTTLARIRRRLEAVRTVPPHTS